MQTTDTRILRWGKKTHTAYGQENAGKNLTDNNPYLEIDSESFDWYTEILPPGGLMAFGPGKALKQFRETLKDGKTPRLAKTMFKYIPGLLTGNFKEKFQGGPNDRVNVKAYSTTEEQETLKREIRDYLDSKDVIGGFTKIDRRYINEEGEENFPYQTFLILGMEMTKDTIMEIPYPTLESGKIFDFEVYHNGGLFVHELAEFIRSKGVRCLAHVPLKADVTYVPHAINAGLGNYSTHGLMLTKEWGTRLRLFGISLDIKLPIDTPRDFNFEEFCARCRMCYKACPEEAIPKDARDWRGAMKRRVSIKRCSASMSKRRFCGYCLKVCPFNNFGYEKGMESLPAYYHYNTLDEVIDKESIKNNNEPL